MRSLVLTIPHSHFHSISSISLYFHTIQTFLLFATRHFGANPFKVPICSILNSTALTFTLVKIFSLHPLSLSAIQNCFSYNTFHSFVPYRLYICIVDP
mmetsp:Transcript_8905/g.32856  ORF Transcript_8905/g.32856 Transcript_8905/m.32856 type:complete len:98 (-) Transcript_8905:3925-4218(-)